jgi:purine-binding chemotaxis protein CheW
VSEQCNIVGFRVGSETFGVAIHAVHEIVRMEQITALPNAPAHVEGVINLRGHVVPVVDLRKRLGEPRTKHKKNRIVFADVNGCMTGLIVDSANEVLRVSASDIEPAPTVLGDADSHYVRGVAKIRDRLIILIDLNRLLGFDASKQCIVPSEP